MHPPHSRNLHFRLINSNRSYPRWRNRIFHSDRKNTQPPCWNPNRRRNNRYYSGIIDSNSNGQHNICTARATARTGGSTSYHAAAHATQEPGVVSVVWVQPHRSLIYHANAIEIFRRWCRFIFFDKTFVLMFFKYITVLLFMQVWFVRDRLNNFHCHDRFLSKIY